MIIVKDVRLDVCIYLNTEHVILAKEIKPLETYELILTGNNKVYVDYNTMMGIRKGLE